MTDSDAPEYITTREAADMLGLSHSRALVVLQENDCTGREVNPQCFKWRRADVEAICELRAELPERTRTTPPRIRPITEDDNKGDFCGLTGAGRLKERLEAYWRQRGGVVNVDLVEGGYVQTMRTSRFDVRSDMLNGWPREWVEK